MYQQMIREDMARLGRVGAADPRHIEAWMRSEHPTLDGLSSARFACEVVLALECVAVTGVIASEALAQSFGL